MNMDAKNANLVAAESYKSSSTGRAEFELSIGSYIMHNSITMVRMMRDGKFCWQVELPISGLTVSSGRRYLLLIDQHTQQQLSGFGEYLRMSCRQQRVAADDEGAPAALRVGNPHGRWCLRSAPLLRCLNIGPSECMRWQKYISVLFMKIISILAYR
jgi:hypothetical protein